MKPERVGNYLVFPAFATGASASVHLARLVRADGFRRLSVLKRFHPALFSEATALDRFLREARLSSRVRSPYVVATLDIIPSELALVMELVHGVTLARLMEEARKSNAHLAAEVIVAIMGNVLRGLDAAHEATGEDGKRLDLLHRDVAPQNVMVGADGLARLLDFGVATALGERITASGEVRGTLGYIAPEQLRGQVVTRRADLFAAGVILWEMLTEQRLRSIDRDGIIANIDGVPDAPSKINENAPAALDAVVMKALAADPGKRYPNAVAMVTELEAAVRPATPQEVAAVVERLAFDDLDRMRELVLAAERDESSGDGSTTVPETSSTPTVGPSIGSVVAGRYRVESIIGRGGMGIVVGARHLTLNQSVALKFLTRKTESSAVERVLREARTAMRLTGDHVVRVFDAGLEQGAPYIVMEKLGGTDLKQVLAEEGPMPITQVVGFGLQLCEVLVEAHALGIVHRDLKPSNLFIVQPPGGQRVLKVLDFGIAKVAVDDESGDHHASLTETGVLLGSPGYMSPEQLRSAKNVDARTDVWAVGVVLYELLTGVHPFQSNATNETLARVMADEPEPIRKLRPEVPEALARTVHECLRKNPDKRMPSAAALAHALEPFAAPGQLSTSRIRRMANQAGMPLVHESEASGRRRKLGAAAIVIAVLGVGAGVAFRRAPAPTAPASVSEDKGATSLAATPATTTNTVENASAAAPVPAEAPAVDASATSASVAAASAGRGQRKGGSRAGATTGTTAVAAPAASATPAAAASAEPAAVVEPVKRPPKTGGAEAGTIEPDPSAAFE